jgi:hypothetical protein
MEHFQKIFNHIYFNNLPLVYKIEGNDLLIDCRCWDINEIDELIMKIGGTRNEFIIRIKGENYEKKSFGIIN